MVCSGSNDSRTTVKGSIADVEGEQGDGDVYILADI